MSRLRKEVDIKKLIALMGIAVGFVFGSRAGRRPYEQVEAQVRKALGRKGVQESVAGPASWADVPDGNGSDE